MRVLRPNEIAVPYGSSRPAGELLHAVPATGGGVTLDCRMAHVVVARAGGDPLRLNSGQYEPGFDAGDASASGLALLHDHLARYCDMWRNAQRRFLDLYFEFIAAEMARHRDDLARLLAPFGTLYRPEDWAFSALRPLPQALLCIAPARGAASYDPGNLVAVDFAFWSGAGPIAVVLGGAGDSRRAAALAALSDTGIAVVEVPAAALAQPPDAGIGALLPAACHRFWADQPFPSGPFSPNLPRDLP